MNRKLLVAAWFALTFMLPGKMFAETHSAPDDGRNHFCQLVLGFALTGHAMNEVSLLYPDLETQQNIPVVASVRGRNDVMCADPAYMMNAIVTIEVSDQKKWYGIFHVHTFPNGDFQSANHYGNVRWRPYQDNKEWKDAWCDYISGIYPEDHRAQCTAN
jgi:hypothetical protein